MTARVPTISITFIENQCGSCGVWFAFETNHYNQLVRTNGSFWCPNGHSRKFVGETAEAKLKRQLQWARDQAAADRARADGAEASLRATKGHVTRLRKRVLDGECPLCGQHLRDVARHVARVHGDEPIEAPE